MRFRAPESTSRDRDALGIDAVGRRVPSRSNCGLSLMCRRAWTGWVDRTCAFPILIAVVLMLGLSGPAGRRGVDRLRRQRRGLALVARRSAEGAPGGAGGEHRRRRPRSGSTSRPSDSGRIVAVRNEPGRISRVLVVQGLGARRDVDGRGAAQRPARLGASTSIRSASTSPRTARTWSTATRTAAAARSVRARAPTCGR